MGSRVHVIYTQQQLHRALAELCQRQRHFTMEAALRIQKPEAVSSKLATVHIHTFCFPSLYIFTYKSAHPHHQFIYTFIFLHFPFSSQFVSSPPRSTSPAMTTTETRDGDTAESQCHKGVKQLFESGLHTLPNKYILPESDRPSIDMDVSNVSKQNLQLPIIDFADLLGPNRAQVLKSLANACQQYGFFQLVHHGISEDVISNMVDVSGRFFNLPFEERSKYMGSDMRAPVRYGTSFNQTKDSVFSWRDFLKLTCHPLPDYLPHWPASPVDFRKLAATYAEETKHLFLTLMEAIVESLGIVGARSNNNQTEEENEDILKDLEDGSQLMVVNYYPPCPEPDLTLGIPPHSDYGFLTLLLQDEVEGLQIQYQGKWLTVDPIANAFVVNVGDHLEIFSNGRYKSVMHRVLVNAKRCRISVASLHSLPYNRTVRPSPILIDKSNPKRYRDTDFGSFLEYVSSREPRRKDFLESRKLASQMENGNGN